MCGIAGIAAAPGPRPDAVARMVDALVHRGPDGHGVERIDAAAGVAVDLGHTRLAVLDTTAAAAQPMGDAAGNRLVYNGELYNHAALRNALIAEGERFTSSGDTEVVLRALGRWGERALDRFDGMFALAWWSAAERRVLLARDRLGLKPLYVAHGRDGAVVFASEVRAILATDLVSRAVDPDGLAAILWNGFSVAPRTLVAAVRSLRPGHATWVDPGRGEGASIGRERAYWSLPDGSGAPAEPVDVRDAFDAAVARRLCADVPLGAFLSGGLDSSAIVASMARAGADVRTFAIAFDDPAFDESGWAAAVAAHVGATHHEVRVTEDAFRRWLPDAVAAYDQPSFDGLNTYFVSRAAREAGLTVALSGLGADELFGGYPHFGAVPAIVRASRLAGALPSRARGWLRAAFDDRSRAQTLRGKLVDVIGAAPVGAVHAYQLANALFRRDAIERLTGRALSPDYCGLPDGVDADASGDVRDATSRLSLRLFLGERCLRDTDQMSMASSLEVRAPFTDHALVECALRVAAADRTAGSPNKRYESALFAARLPATITRRAKRGFVFPLARWLRDAFDPAADAALRDPALAESIGLDAEAVAAFRDAFVRGDAGVPWSRVWLLAQVMRWCDTHGVGAPEGSAVACA